MTNSTMSMNTDIVFDAKSGISEEEQREILAQINSITERNRLSFAGGTEDGENKKRGAKRRFKAKKSGGVFPLLVNIAAIAALAGGLYAIYTLQGKTNAQVREGTKVYNTAERALIEEIRKETSSRLEAKENEISLIASKLEDIDSELQGLYSSNEGLTAEQRAAENMLKTTQDEYRNALAQLQDERSRILEEARAREASLQAQLESRTRELAIVAEQSAAALDIAMNEMERLAREQAQAATVEAQMGALFANLNAAIAENRFQEALDIITTMRAFLNTPAFQSLRSIQARKELYTQSINSFATMIDEARKNQMLLALAGKSSAGEMERTIADLSEENVSLKEQLTRTIEAASNQGAGLATQLAEQNNQIITLRSQNSSLQRDNSDLRAETRIKDQTITTLETEKSRQDQTIATLRSESTQARTELNTANRELGELRPRVQTLNTLNSTLSNTIQELTDQLNNMQNRLQE